MGKCYAALEGRLAGREYLLDGGFSAADVSCGQAVYMARHFKRLDGFDAVTRWYDLIAARDAFQASLPRGDQLYVRDFFEVPE